MSSCENCSDIPISYNQIAISVANSAFGLLILVINSLILASFYSKSHARTLSNYFIASLAFLDVLMGILPLNFFTANQLISRWPVGSFACDLWLFLDYSGCAIGQYAVLLITFDRYFSVKFPIAYNSWRTKAKVFALIGASWIIPSVTFGFLIFGWPYSNSSTGKCFAKFSVHPVANTFAVIFYFWLAMGIMVCLLLAIYRVALALRSRSGLRTQVFETETDASMGQSITDAPLTCTRSTLARFELWTFRDFSTSIPKSTGDKKLKKTSCIARSRIILRDCQNSSISLLTLRIRKRMFKSTRNICLILLAYIVLWTPFHLVSLLSPFLCPSWPLYVFSYWLTYVNSFINPFCYAVTNPRIRKSIHSITGYWIL
ncbi:unnamed protein product [Schistocephalus solidus]|uniref:G_PROTEIN_RECEP_F1_2 domain-containing protein n=1 Tax=Schistocephalus solidus TaxID=70667 RepID=A0A183SG99_SCHSO|nr:unnamed protein product [Schistocephalus solidus]